MGDFHLKTPTIVKMSDYFFSISARTRAFSCLSPLRGYTSSEGQGQDKGESNG
jgi:hypothetical protein